MGKGQHVEFLKLLVHPIIKSDGAWVRQEENVVEEFKCQMLSMEEFLQFRGANCITSCASSSFTYIHAFSVMELIMENEFVGVLNVTFWRHISRGVEIERDLNAVNIFY